jgi:hypothetical protein
MNEWAPPNEGRGGPLAVQQSTILPKKGHSRVARDIRTADANATEPWLMQRRGIREAFRLAGDKSRADALIFRFCRAGEVSGVGSPDAGGGRRYRDQATEHGPGISPASAAGVGRVGVFGHGESLRSASMGSAAHLPSSDWRVRGAEGYAIRQGVDRSWRI